MQSAPPPATDIRDRAGTLITWIVIAIGLAGIVGAAVLWPTGDAPDLGNRPRTYVDATIRSVASETCDSIEVPGALEGCRRVTVRITSGDDEGGVTTFLVPETRFEVPTVRPGDPIVLLDTPSTPGEYRYSFVDFQRGGPLLALALLFAFVVVAFGRTKGLRALLGLAASAAVLVMFIVPALLRGSPALPVAVVGTVLVAYLALYVAKAASAGAVSALSVGTGCPSELQLTSARR